MIRTLGTENIHGEAVDFFYENVPEPVNILGAFLSLVDSEVDVPCNLRVLCGYLHQMSMMIDFTNYIAIPVVARKDVVFTKAMMRGWEDSWKDMQKQINLAEFDMENLSIDTLAEILNRLGLGVASQAPYSTYSARVEVSQETPPIAPVINEQGESSSSRDRKSVV